MTPIRIVEVETVAHFLDGDGVFLCSVFKDELFEEEESALVRDFLAHLDERLPGVFRSKTSTIWALAVLNDVLDLKDLLQDGIC